MQPDNRPSSASNAAEKKHLSETTQVYDTAVNSLPTLSHELRLENVAAESVVFEHGLIELHRDTRCLIVQRD